MANSNDSGSITDGVTTTGFNFNKTSVGWTAGGGFEGHLAGNWTWKIEYLFLTLDEPTGYGFDANHPPVYTHPAEHGESRSDIHGQHRARRAELQMAVRRS